MSKDKNGIFITSYHQSGGVTAHTVNFGPTARSMNDELGAQLRDRSPNSARVTVVAVLGDGEAFGFANQILSWLKSNGYERAEGVDQAVYSQPTIGQSINKRSDNEYELIIGTLSQQILPHDERLVPKFFAKVTSAIVSNVVVEQ